MSAFNALHEASQRRFASDNYAGIHPEVLAAIAGSNGGHESSYGADPYTRQLEDVVRQQFGERARSYPVFNGTGANVVSLLSLIPSWGSVICAESAHINVDESNAPERIGGAKLLAVPTSDGKLTPELIEARAVRFGDQHFAQPSAVSITQSTELGTVYSPAEVSAIAECTHRLGMKLHMDGSRLANAAAFLNASLKELTQECGVDVLSFGGTKNGLMIGELVVDFSGNQDLPYLVKSNMQLGSKLRFISAQFLALFHHDLWRTNALHANAMAARLREGAAQFPQITLTQPTQANAVFAIVPPEVVEELRSQFHFYDWDTARAEVRWMCAFDTTEEDVDAFVAAMGEHLGRP